MFSLSVPQIYEASTKLNPPVKIIPLSSPVLARYLRFYPTSCVPPKCCLSVEIFGCDVGESQCLLREASLFMAGRVGAGKKWVG